MKTIRHGVFETNSSSTHAISIAHRATLNQGVPQGPDGSICIQLGEFGWGPDGPFHYCADKLSYAATYAYTYGGNELLAMFENAVLTHLGAKRIDYILGDDYHPHGYIDHQSRPEAADIFQDESTLLRFLFSSESSFELDHDNY